ncbi:MAG: KTSC domain-containing protein [Methanobrevibacter sp.]|nr:KTSC domain-containing protein [Methanobrevibacter sp.]
MELKEVVSSNITNVGYENDTLFVKYKSGATYKYKNFPQELYESFLEAESKGRFMNTEVKGKYEYEKITEEL